MAEPVGISNSDCRPFPLEAIGRAATRTESHFPIARAKQQPQRAGLRSSTRPNYSATLGEHFSWRRDFVQRNAARVSTSRSVGSDAYPPAGKDGWVRERYRPDFHYGNLFHTGRPGGLFSKNTNTPEGDSLSSLLSESSPSRVDLKEIFCSGLRSRHLGNEIARLLPDPFDPFWRSSHRN
jgi:hypothetical protein